MGGPDFTNREPESIIKERIFFSSDGFVFRGLSWADYAKRNNSIVALQYAALEMRKGIEHLLFEEIVMCVGGNLPRSEYVKCLGNSTKLHKIVGKLNPDYIKLVRFTQAVLSTYPNAPNIVEWDYKLLLKYWGTVSEVLHWAGEEDATYNSAQWFVKCLSMVEEAGHYLRDNMSRGHEGAFRPETMEPEVKQCWNDFKAGKTDLEGVRIRVNISLPILSQRWTERIVGHGR